MFQKTRIPSQTLIACTIVLLLFALFCTNTCSAVIVWQEDFNDGTYDGWTIYLGEFQIADNVLIANGSFGVWNFIRYPSDVAYGFWSFDVLSEDAPQNHTYVYIISSSITDVPNYRLCIWTGSYLNWAPSPGVSLLKQNNSGTFSIAGWFTGTLSGWHSYNVTRDQTGLFNIFVDGTLRITVRDNDITTSGYFRFGAQENSGIDNIIVGDFSTITPTSTPPPIPGFPLLAILIAVPFALGFAIILRRRNVL
ncbi:MAG: hypothetical protein ACFE89_10120 [Candidatus Hodarchaeota archaeon]